MSVIEEVAAALGTDHLQVHVTNAWIVATPEASIIRSECIIEISAAGYTETAQTTHNRGAT